MTSRQPLALVPGTRLGVYEILSPLGAGGMGEVYQAKDTRLKRDVALKVLPDTFAADPDRLGRFQREAELLATLNHPNIAGIYGLEDSNGVRALVLELVEGPTLADRIAKGPIRLDEGLGIARQIADALEAAHERGVIHRDLKPANIKVRPDGTVKVLDFGLAKLAEAPAASRAGGLSQSPTITTPAMMTGVGTILGTAAYMSPEQARGQRVDKRTDIWAFGCVLYEMLTAKAGFARDTIADALAAVVEREPQWALLPDETPSNIRVLLQRCLEKDPRSRLRDIGDARIELDHALRRPGPAIAVESAESKELKRPYRLRGSTLAVAALVGLAISGTAVVMVFRTRESPPPVRLSLFGPGQITPQLSATVSPDGRRVAFVSTDASGKSLLWIRPLDAIDAHALAGSDDAAHPFWSPDGRSIGFQAQGKLKTMAADGGPVQTLTNAPVRLGASWGSSGQILFIPRAGELATIPASGGQPVTVMTVEESRRYGSPWWPHFLPDGRHFLFYARSATDDRRGIYGGSLDSKDITLVLPGDFKGAYGPPGFLFFVRSDMLMAQPFDADRLQVHGEPALVASGVWTGPAVAQASYSVSEKAVAYVNASLSNRQLEWFDRQGQAVGRIGKPDRYFTSTPELNRDGSVIAIAYRGVRLLDTRDGAPTRFTFGAGTDSYPLWSPDGRQIAFFSLTGSGRRGNVMVKSLNGAGPEERIAELPVEAELQDWSPDGRFLVYGLPGAKSELDLWLLPLTVGRKAVPFLRTGFTHAQSRVSPDGRWIAYTSNETGGDEVYVESFPKPGIRHQVSDHGGAAARWRRDGRELFYLAGDQYLTAVPVLQAETLKIGRAIPLFRTRTVVQGSQATLLPTPYDVTGNGQRFVLLVPPDDPEPPMTVVLNWQSALQK